jgi:hypothetical protein
MAVTGNRVRERRAEPEGGDGRAAGDADGDGPDPAQQPPAMRGGSQLPGPVVLGPMRGWLVICGLVAR